MTPPADVLDVLWIGADLFLLLLLMLVRHDDGREALVFPGADASVEHPQSHKPT